MDKVVKLKRLCSKPLLQRYLAAAESERAALRPVLDDERQWRIEKMVRKGYTLEATVMDLYGLFTRGQARGTVRAVPEARPQP